MKIIKTAIVGILLVGLMSLVIELFYNKPLEVINTDSTATSTVEVLEKDLIDKAREELERINSELDLEEAKLIQEKEAINSRLESIRETRESFQ